MSNNKGFGLVETIIASGIGLLIVAALTTTIVQVTKSMSRIDAKQDLNALTFEVQTMVSSRVTCTQALNPGQTFDLNRASQPRFEASGRINSDPNAGLDLLMSLPSGETMLPNSTNPLTGYNLIVQAVKIYDAQDAGADLAGNRFYKVNLVGSFTAPIAGSDVGLKPKLLGSFFVRVDNGTNQMSECFTVDSSDLTGFTCPQGQTLVGINTSGVPQCEEPSRLMANVACAEGEFLTGFDANGQPQCATGAGGGGGGGASCTEGDKFTAAGTTVCTCRNGRWECEQDTI